MRAFGGWRIQGECFCEVSARNAARKPHPSSAVGKWTARGVVLMHADNCGAQSGFTPPSLGFLLLELSVFRALLGGSQVFLHASIYRL